MIEPNHIRCTKINFTLNDLHSVAIGNILAGILDMEATFVSLTIEKFSFTKYYFTSSPILSHKVSI